MTKQTSKSTMARLVLASVCCLWLAGCTGGVALGPDAVKGQTPDGTIEMHIISFASDADFQNCRNDPRRTAQAWLLEKSSAKLELLPMANVSGS